MGRTILVRADRLCGSLLAAFIAVIAVESAGIQIPIVREAVVFAAVTFVPGAFVLAVLGFQPRLRATDIVYSMGTSLLLVMMIGVVLHLLPPVLVYQPLTVLPLSASILLLGGALVQILRTRQSTVALSIPTSLSELDPCILFFSLLPLWSILAVTYLNTTYDPRLIIAVLVLLSIIPALVVALPFKSKDLRYGITTMALAVLYHKSLWLGHTFGGHASVVHIWEAGTWSGSGEVLLPNAVLMPAYARLLGVTSITVTEVVMPLFVMFIPLAAYLAFERYVQPETAFLAASLFVFAHPFYFQYASAPRAPFPVLFLTLIGTVIADESLTSFQSRALAILFAPGIAVSHYGTSYYVMFAALGALVLLVAYRFIDGLVESLRSTFNDSVRELGSPHFTVQPNRVLTLPFVTFYTITVLSWYLYIGQGSKFEALLEHILNAYRSLFIETSGQGSTATRLATDYGTQSIGLSKSLYITIALLLAFGFTIAYCRRFLFNGPDRFDDEFLALATLLFLLFGGSFIFSGEWGGGRPMMIVFSLGAVFSAVGLVTIGDFLIWFRDRLLGADKVHFTSPGNSAFAIILAVFFVLNTGVMAAIVFGGEAPSNVPVEDLSKNYDETDLAMHAWFADHRNVTHPIYGDRLARAQATDWMNGEIAARAERGLYRFRRKQNFDALDQPGIENGYVLLLGHNVIEGKIEVNYITTRNMSEYTLNLDQRNRIYSNGAAMVYFTNRTSEQ